MKLFSSISAPQNLIAQHKWIIPMAYLQSKCSASIFDGTNSYNTTPAHIYLYMNALYRYRFDRRPHRLNSSYAYRHWMFGINRGAYTQRAKKNKHEIMPDSFLSSNTFRINCLQQNNWITIHLRRMCPPCLACPSMPWLCRIIAGCEDGALNSTSNLSIS